MQLIIFRTYSHLKYKYCISYASRCNTLYLTGIYANKIRIPDTGLQLISIDLIIILSLLLFLFTIFIEFISRQFRKEINMLIFYRLTHLLTRKVRSGKVDTFFFLSIFTIKLNFAHE
jgi:hypothetical protein